MIERVHRERHHAIPIDRALSDPHLLGAALGGMATWRTWCVAVKAAHGLRLECDEREVFNSIAGGRPPPQQRVKEFWAVVGRRAGKSRAASMIATYAALLQQHHRAPGESAFVLTLSPTRAQAKLVLGYCCAFVQQSTVLREEIESITATELRLRNGVTVSTHPASFRSTRGRTLLSCVLDEIAYFRDETSAIPDLEIYRSLLPSLVTGGMLVGISTGYRRSGLLFDKYKNFYGVDDPDCLVVSGPSAQFNPTLDTDMVARASRTDPEAARSEWEGSFRSDIGNFLDDADIDACIDFDRPIELPPKGGIVYRAFCDASGGRGDAFTIAIGHKADDRTVVDVVRGRLAPFNPKDVVEEYAALLREYGCPSVRGDNYSAEWVTTAFKDLGVKYERAELPKGRIYLEGLPHFTRRIVNLPNHPRLLRELRLLERRTHQGGRDTVDHAPNGSDDFCNAVFGMLHLAQQRKQRLRTGSIGCDSRVTWDDPQLERLRVRWVKIPESLAPAARGKS